MQNEPNPMTMEEMIQENKRLQKALDEAATAVEAEKKRKTIWKYLTILTVWIFAGIALYETKLQIVWRPVSDSPQMCVVMSDWWGLKVQTVYPVWRKPTGETREYSENWCIAYPDNTWRIFYNNDGKSSAYMFPLAKYGTYF